MHLYPINGACHRVAADETAFAYRDANFATVILAAWHDPAVDAERIQWVRDYYARHCAVFRAGRLRQLHGGRRPDPGCRTTTRATYDRLVAVKRTYDPDNLFHLNQNIPPSG